MSPVRSNVYILAGGGSGGHLFPGLAVADQLRRLDPAARILFTCSSRGIDRTILDPTPYGVVPQSVLPTPRRRRHWPAFVRSLIGSGRLVRRLIVRLHPKAVLGLGGFAAVPAVWCAARAGYRTALLNPDAIPGRANKLLAKHTAAVFTQFESTAAYLTKTDHSLIQVVGCPVRPELLGGDRGEAIRHFKLLSGRKTLLVFGGSQAAATINAGVAGLQRALDGLAGAWQMVVVTGRHHQGLTDVDGDDEHMRVRCVTYCHRMDLAYAAADIVLCRAGASSVAELTATGTPSVLMPYPWHADAHQYRNAEPLAAVGAAVICDDTKDAAGNAHNLQATLLPILTDEVKLEAMTRAAESLARPNAAEEVARWLSR